MNSQEQRMLGLNILVSYRGIPQSPGWATGDCVVRALRKLGHSVDSYGNYYQTSIPLQSNLNVFEKHYDLLLYMECGDPDPQYFELKRVDARNRFSWFFDSSLYPDFWKHQVAELGTTLNFIANSRLVTAIGNGTYLPYAADEGIHAAPAIDKIHDFLIIGSDRPERRHLHDDLKSIFPDKKVSLLSGVFREDYIRELAASRFVVNDIAGGGNGLIPMRPFETLAAGSTIITPRGDGVSELGIPCYEYGCISELSELDLRELTEEGAWALPSHTYTNRCERILSHLQ